MRTNRSRIEVMALIAHKTREPQTPFHIMYRCELNHAQVKEHTQHMVGAGLLEKRDNMYALTHKGAKFLTLCNEINESTDGEFFNDSIY